MKYIGFDMFGMLTMGFDRPVRLIKDLDLNLSTDLNSSNLNISMIPA